jgi:hypothetical protein
MPARRRFHWRCKMKTCRLYGHCWDWPCIPCLLQRQWKRLLAGMVKFSCLGRVCRPNQKRNSNDNIISIVLDTSTRSCPVRSLWPICAISTRVVFHRRKDNMIRVMSFRRWNTTRVDMAQMGHKLRTGQERVLAPTSARSFAISWSIADRQLHDLPPRRESCACRRWRQRNGVRFLLPAMPPRVLQSRTNHHCRQGSELRSNDYPLAISWSIADRQLHDLPPRRESCACRRWRQRNG